MTEVLTMAPEVIETDIPFEQFEQVETEELLFPKLDGILLPLVIDNAEVVAPCLWMGGAEVTLTVALNNYYQQMTEGNADDVIADVYDFLAGKHDPLEEIRPEQQEPELLQIIEPELDPTILVIEHIQNPYTDWSEKTPRESDEIIFEPATPRTEVPSPAEPVRTPRSIQPAPHEAPVPDTEPLVQRDSIPVTPPDSPQASPLPLEVQKEIPANEDTITIPPSTRTSDANSVSSTLHQEHVQHPGEAIYGSANSEAETSPTPTPPTLSEHDLGDAPRDATVFDEDVDIPPDAAESNETDEPTLPNTTADRGYAPQETITEPGPPDYVTTATQHIDALLADLALDTDCDEDAEHEMLQGLVDIVNEMSQTLPPGTQELQDIYVDIEPDDESLLALYGVLLENASVAHAAELATRLVALTHESPREQEDMVPVAATVHRHVRSLTIIVKRLKKALSHVAAMGRLALRFHTLAQASTRPNFGIYLNPVLAIH